MKWAAGFNDVLRAKFMAEYYAKTFVHIARPLGRGDQPGLWVLGNESYEVRQNLANPMEVADRWRGKVDVMASVMSLFQVKGFAT